MKIETPSGVRIPMLMENHGPLEPGQVWATHAAIIEVVALGRTLIHYRIINQFGERRVSAQISAVEPMEKYLQTHAARLVRKAGNG